VAMIKVVVSDEAAIGLAAKLAVLLLVDLFKSWTLIHAVPLYFFSVLCSSFFEMLRTES